MASRGDDDESRERFARYEREMEVALGRGAAASAAGGQALARLLQLAETRETGQIRVVARFIASTFNGNAFPFDLFDLRAVDVDIGDDMLACIDAIRWGRNDLYKLVPNGEARILAVLESWGIQWPDST